MSMDRGKWLNLLAKAVAPAASGEAFTRLVDYLPQLRDIPDRMLTKAAITAIATACQGEFPSLEQLRAGLQPTSASGSAAAVTGSISDALFDLVMARSGGQPGADLCEWLAGKGRDSAEIARWISPEVRARQQAAADWSHPENVSKAAQGLRAHPMDYHLGRLLCALVSRHAPRNLGWVPPRFHHTDDQLFEHITPENLLA